MHPLGYISLVAPREDLISNDRINLNSISLYSCFIRRSSDLTVHLSNLNRTILNEIANLTASLIDQCMLYLLR